MSELPLYLPYRAEDGSTCPAINACTTDNLVWYSHIYIDVYTNIHIYIYIYVYIYICICVYTYTVEG